MLQEPLSYFWTCSTRNPTHSETRVSLALPQEFVEIILLICWVQGGWNLQKD